MMTDEITKKGVLPMKRKIEPIELLKTVAVLLLMVALVCLCLIYMLSYQTTGQYTFTKDTMQTLGGESVKYQYTDYMKSSYVSPKWIGFSADRYGEDIGFYTLGGENPEVYQSIEPFYEKLFAEEGKMEVLSAEEGESLFLSATEGDHIHIVYETDIPKTLLYAMTAENAMLPAVSGEYLREIIIMPDRYLYDGITHKPLGTNVYTSVYTFYALARDSEGRYYRYTTSFVPSGPDDVSFNTNYYLAYTTADAYFYYRLAKDMTADDFFIRNGFSQKVSDFTMLPRAYKGEIPFGSVSYSPYYPKTPVVNALLAAMLINPEQVTSFTDSDGVRFYYDEGRNVSISPSGHLEYTAHGTEGLPLADLFEYHAVGEVYDLRDYAGAALMLARALENAAGLKNPCMLYLSGIYSNGNTVTISFGYAADGLPILIYGGSEVLSLEFEEGRLKKIAYDLLPIEVAPSVSVLSDVLWQLRSALLMSEELSEYAYVYAPEKENEKTDAAFVGRILP